MAHSLPPLPYPSDAIRNGRKLVGSDPQVDRVLPRGAGERAF